MTTKEDKTLSQRIIERNITNEDGDFYGVCGDLTRAEAYEVICEDLDGYGILGDFEFKAKDLVKVDFYQTTKCPSGKHEGYIWWGKPAKEDTVKFLGKGWGFYYD
jgi:hypothetical protein